jgi:branched-subunit amino acid transport protein
VSTPNLILVIVILAVGTYSFRLVGVVLGDRVRLSPAVDRLLPLGAVALLTGLAATAALTDAGHFAGVARPVGVLAGVVTAWFKAPFVAAVLVAAGVAAGLRLLGLP